MNGKQRLDVSLGSILCGAIVALGAASAAEPSDAPYSPAISVAEIMSSMVMPAADVLWSAVSIEVTEQGQIEKKPESDEQWAELRAAAVTLVEATNSLIVPGRHAAPADAAPAGVEAASPTDLAPAQIEALLEGQRPAWIAHAEVLRAAALQALAAVDARDTDAITEIGGTIDEACESCHLQFWYPEQP